MASVEVRLSFRSLLGYVQFYVHIYIELVIVPTFNKTSLDEYRICRAETLEQNYLATSANSTGIRHTTRESVKD